MATNYATNLAPRPFNAATANPGPAPAWFRHTPATGKPAEPAFPGVMNHEAQQQFLAWKAGGVAPRHPHASAKVIEFETYRATTAYVAWDASDRTSREAQWRLFSADAIEQNLSTVSVSADPAGTGSGAPPAYIPPGANVP